MPIALLLQFCLATAVPRTLVANHNRHLAILRSQRNAATITKTAATTTTKKKTTTSITSITTTTTTTSTTSLTTSATTPTSRHQPNPLLATTAAVSSLAVWRCIAALAVPLAGSTNNLTKRLYGPPIGFRPWTTRSVAGAGAGAGAITAAASASAPAAVAPIAPVVTVHHVYADCISFSPLSAPSSLVSSSSSSSSQHLSAAAALRGMASTGVRRRLSAKNSVDESRRPNEDVAIASASCPTSRPTSVSKLEEVMAKSSALPSAQLAELMGPPPVPGRPSSSEQTTRLSRASTASSVTSTGRTSNPNRLSLTLPLPIALPTPEPTRPTPAPSVTSASHPPTPASGSTASSNGTSTTSWASGDHQDPNNFIIAVAAQERRVLELREELARAETELTTLKNQWTQQEGSRKRTAARITRVGAMHSMPTTPRGDAHATAANSSSDDSIAARRSVELDRRRAMLLNHQQQQHHQQQQATPGSPRRRVIRGGHTRTLSLLSPTKMDNTFTVHGDDGEPLSAGLVGIERRSTDIGSAYRTAAIQKRASWQPRVRPSSTIVPPPPGMGMSAIVEDLKQGFRTLATFVDDIRQVTVGDEPITGQVRRPRDDEWAVGGGGLSRVPTPSDPHQTTRPSITSSRPRLEPSSSTDSHPTSGTQTPTKPPKAVKKSLLDDEVDPVSDHTSNKAAARKKHFSWAPLEFSNLDAEWASWEPAVPAAAAASPCPNKSSSSSSSTRWSGITATSSGDDILPGVPVTTGGVRTPCNENENKDQDEKTAFDDLVPQMVTKLSPTNLKRATVDFMDHWEKSLTTAPSSTPVVVEQTTTTNPNDAGSDNLISF